MHLSLTTTRFGGTNPYWSHRVHATIHDDEGDFKGQVTLFLSRPGTPSWDTQNNLRTRPTTNSVTWLAVTGSNNETPPAHSTTNRVMSIPAGTEADLLHYIRDHLYDKFTNLSTAPRGVMSGFFYPGTDQNAVGWSVMQGFAHQGVLDVWSEILVLCPTCTTYLNRASCAYRFTGIHPVCAEEACQGTDLRDWRVRETDGITSILQLCGIHRAERLTCIMCHLGAPASGFQGPLNEAAALALADRPVVEGDDVATYLDYMGYGNYGESEICGWCYSRVVEHTFGPPECANCGNRSYSAGYDEEREFCFPCDQANHYWRVLDYSHKPQPIFHPEIPDDPRTLYHGFEFEVEGMYHDRAVEWAEYCDLAPDLFYLKYDGSLDSGTEVVTHPFTYDWAKTNFPFDAFDVAVDEFGAYPSEPSAGTHCHVSKASFSRAHMWKFLQVHFRLPALVQLMGGRPSTEYADWNLRGVRDSVKDISMKKRVSTGRLAINVNPAHTVELRYPAGGFSTFLARKNIELPNALYQFSGELSIQHIQEGVIDTPGQFIWWLEQEKAQFPQLFKYVQERTMTPAAFERRN